jgi:hypothetical protein
MKKIQKRFLGYSGLALLTAVTIYAAFLPNPNVSAASSITDTITVRVIGNAPSAEVVTPASGETTAHPNWPINIDYENTRTLDVTLEYKDRNGNIRTKLLRSGPVEGGETGSLSFDFGPLGEEFGFGDYTLRLSGIGIDNVGLQGDSVNFMYVPVLADVTQDADSGKTFVDLDYDPYSEEGPGKVASLEINVYDENGQLVEALSPIIVNAPNKKVEIPFSAHDIKSGKYRIDIIAYGVEQDELYSPYITSTEYEPNDVAVPNTGSLFSTLNASKTDFLITGAGIFIIIGVSSFIYVLKRSKQETKRRK